MPGPPPGGGMWGRGVGPGNAMYFPLFSDLFLHVAVAAGCDIHHKSL